MKNNFDRSHPGAFPSLPQQAIDEFKDAWKKSFGEELSDDRASMEATTLLEFYTMLLDREFRKSRSG